MTPQTLIQWTNDLLAWREGAHELLRDWLDSHGFDGEFRQRSGIHLHDGIVFALPQIGAIEPSDVTAFPMEVRDMRLALARYARVEFDDGETIRARDIRPALLDVDER